jgi:hypothetical protein
VKYAEARLFLGKRRDFHATVMGLAIVLSSRHALVLNAMLCGDLCGGATSIEFIVSNPECIAHAHKPPERGGIVESVSIHVLYGFEICDEVISVGCCEDAMNYLIDGKIVVGRINGGKCFGPSILGNTDGSHEVLDLKECIGTRIQAFPALFTIIVPLVPERDDARWREIGCHLT